jgi:competence protein ComEA
MTGAPERPGRAEPWPSRARVQLADRMPASWRGARWGVPARAAATAALLAAVVGGVALVRSGTVAEPVAVALPARASPASPAVPPPASSVPAGGMPPAGTGTPAAAAELVVDVVGQVRSPGVVRLPAGARVQDAVESAGGASRSADLAALNLARPLVDGEQIVVPRPGEHPAVTPGAAAPAASAGPSGGPRPVLDLNTATQADLDVLPGIGPVLAGRILAFRSEHGRFSRVEELAEVAGIGEHLLAQLTPLVRV